ncbi:MAG: hypothetical protein RR203_07905 [Synergistaceae bacterium]
MKNLADVLKDQKLDFKCENCGKTLKASINDAIKKKVIKCPKCGTEICLSSDDKTKSDLKRLERTCKNLFK